MTTILRIRGLRVRFGGPQRAGWLPPGAALPGEEETTVRLEIVRNEDGFFLESASSNPHFPAGDTWHATLEEALEQAESAFGVKASEWQAVG